MNEIINSLSAAMAAGEGEFNALPFLIGAVVLAVLGIILRANIIHERNKLLPPLYPEQPEEQPMSEPEPEQSTEPELSPEEEQTAPPEEEQTAPPEEEQSEVEETLPAEEVEEEEKVLICNGCGSKVSSKSNFCQVCGEKVH